MRKTTLLATALLFIIALVLVGCTTDTRVAKDADSTVLEKTNSDVMVKDDSAMMEKNSSADAMMEKDSDSMMEDKSGSMMEKDDSAMMEKNESAMMESEDSMMEHSYVGKTLAGTTTPYLEFNKNDYMDAIADGKVILLNFYANWCPVCKDEQVEAFDAFNDLDNKNVIGFRVNYKDSDTDDDEVALAKQFGITYQHTKVLLINGTQSLKTLESWSKADYVAQLATV